MASRDFRDLIGGLLLLLLGGFVVAYGALSYELGTIRQMGPGLFPVALGAMLGLMGAAIAAAGWSRTGDPIKVEVRPLLSILGSIVAFGLLIEPTGFIPASASAVVIAMLAERRNSPLAIGATAVALVGLCYAVFELALGLAIPLVKWPL